MSAIEEYVRDNLSEAAIWGQLAEEAAELAAAAAKVARVLRGENPTPVTEAVAKEVAVAEWLDVLNVANVLDLKSDSTLQHYKMLRWHDRLADLAKQKEVDRRF